MDFILFFQKNKTRVRLCSALLAVACQLLLSQNLAAQVKPPPGQPPAPQSDASDFIEIRFADLFSYQLLGRDTLQKLIGEVELKHDSVYIFCDSALISNSTFLRAKGNFILQHGDSTTIFSDSATYRSDTKIAELFRDVSMLRGTQKLFTDRLTYDANTKIATYFTGATMTDGETFLTSKKGYFHASTDDIFFKDSVVVVSPDFTLRSDTLQFNASSKVVTFLAPTLIRQDTAKIYTESGFYDINLKKAEFTKNPQYEKNGQKAWADLMRYDGNRNEITLIGDAHFLDTATVATADVIRYNEKTEVTILEGNAYIKDKDRIVTGDTVTYDARNETYSTAGRSHILDGDQILDADKVRYDKTRELGIAEGNVIWQDTTQNLTVVSNYAEHSKKKNYLKASGGPEGRPYLIKLIDGDSLFVSADTLMSIEETVTVDSARQAPSKLDSTAVSALKDSTYNNSVETGAEVINGVVSSPPVTSEDSLAVANIQDSILVVATGLDSLALVDENLPLLSLLEKELPQDRLSPTPPKSEIRNPKPKEAPRKILAFHDVRIYKSDLQAICDSLSYSESDSLFRLYEKPVIWSDTSQFSADTVQIQLANDEIDRIYLRENSFIINSPDEIFYNQIKGRKSTAFFTEGELQRVKVEGNAESVYYALDDDKAYIGVNKTVCSEMMIFFGNNEVEGIRFYAEPTANLIPMKKADHDALKMQGFNWQLENRPNSLADLLKPGKPRPHKVVLPPLIEEKVEKK